MLFVLVVDGYCSVALTGAGSLSPEFVLPGFPGSVQTIRADVSQFLRVTRERHRRGEAPLRVVQGLSDGIDGILRQLFVQLFEGAQERVALVAVGGYGRRELCPYSDIDLLFLRDRQSPDEKIQKLVTFLWDGGFQLGHSVRTPQECFEFMVDDYVTAASLLESRFLIGSRRLYERFQAIALNRFRKRRGEDFARTKLERLKESVLGEGRTIYVLEPHLKEGACQLRDIQRVMWVENIRRDRATFDDLARGEDFASEQASALREAYGMYLRLRCELHFTSGLKQDILERDSLPEMAASLGYQGSVRRSVERLMADYYRHAREVYRFLRHYIETGTQGRRFLSKLSRKFFGKQLKPYLFVEKGILFLNGELPAHDLGEEIVDVFFLAQREGLRLSESLCGTIRQRIDDASVDLSRSPRISERFLSILRDGERAGRVLKSMHEAGVLAGIVPEFRALDGLVDFSGYHQFTVDEHILRTLEMLDRIEAGADDVDQEFHGIFGEIEDRLPLRLALLLHDVGKGMSGDHAVSGSEAAILVCERLGLDEETAETVEFLIYRHLKMFNISEQRNFTEDGVVESFASLVGSAERLKMLYLLTYVDVSSVGPGTWTAWKGAQLAELYQRTLACLRSGVRTPEKLREALGEAGLSHEDRDLVLDHCKRIDSATYVSEILPERMLDHVRLVESFRATGHVQVGQQSFGGYYELTLCCPDRPHLFADLTGVLFSEGFNVLGARIFSRDDGIALDIFYVEVADDVQVDIEKRVTRIRDKLQRIESRTSAPEDLIRQWAKSYRFRKLRRSRQSIINPAVEFDNEASDLYTVIDVVARDRPGLLYDLACAISRLGLDLRTAKVSTLTDRAQDAFYVVEADGKKVSNPARMKEIELSLIQEIESPSSVLADGSFKD
ncbi:MAG: [protein-PII] uridylyltransferase [Planctomycetota bacterium]|nr:[protein-PII] uridylyltransferase [Planctomycetota bacterium]